VLAEFPVRAMLQKQPAGKQTNKARVHACVHASHGWLGAGLGVPPGAQMATSPRYQIIPPKYSKPCRINCSQYHRHAGIYIRATPSRGPQPRPQPSSSWTNPREERGQRRMYGAIVEERCSLLLEERCWRFLVTWHLKPASQHVVSLCLSSSPCLSDSVRLPPLHRYRFARNADRENEVRLK
jgi:hypothetical protein